MSRANRVKTVKEVISGSLPLAKRDKFLNLINGKNKVLKVFVESARAVARSAIVAEDAWKLSKENEVQIIPADLPYLFKHDASPGETFMRWVMLSVQEFERDMVVHRLSHGIAEKRRVVQAALRQARQTKAQHVLIKGRRVPTSLLRTQEGKVKVNGRKTGLSQVRPSARVLAKLQVACRKHEAGQVGWRKLAQMIADIIQRPVAPETARRMKASLLTGSAE
jgi:DNA invertase Pin-like site-specific DNA recombinase